MRLISWWYFMIFSRCEISLWDFMPFGPCPKHGCFQIVGGLGLVAKRWEGGEVMENMLRRDESSWLCISLSLLSLPATAFCSGFFRLLFWLWLWKKSASSLSCLTLLRLHALCCTLFFWDFLAGFPFGFGPLWDFLLLAAWFFFWDFLVRVHAFCYIFFLWDLLMRFHAFWLLWDFLVRFHVF